MERRGERLVADVLRTTVGALAAAGVTEARLEAELLVGHCLALSRTGLYLAARQPVDSERLVLLDSLVGRRTMREPLAYILGEREFWSLPFWVTPDVLIPRPETEFLLETALASRNTSVPRTPCLDLCCGSGVIAVVLARELAVEVMAVDISVDALRVANKNCVRHNVAGAVHLVQADLLCAFQDSASFSLIVANPPYVGREEIHTTLETDVVSYEPLAALDGGVSGLEVITRIRDDVARLLVEGGDMFLEIGAHQGEAVQELFLAHETGCLYEFVKIKRDYAGRHRVVHIRKKSKGRR